MSDTQLVLPLGPYVETVDQPTATLQEKFERFHAANPWVALALEALTRDWLATGRQRVGIKMFIEVLRWEHARRTDGSEFRYNNSFTSRYVRLLIEAHPDWADAFETRALRAD